MKSLHKVLDMIEAIAHSRTLGIRELSARTGFPPPTIKHMVTRHEESAVHMADGYARALCTVSVCAAASGPGAGNFITGLYTAQVDSIPILALTGQNVRAQLDREAFQAVNIAEMAKPVTKMSYGVKDPAMVPWVFREALKMMREGLK
jgi:tartronate-semialdehyde synthase